MASLSQQGIKRAKRLLENKALLKFEKGGVKDNNLVRIISQLRQIITLMRRMITLIRLRILTKSKKK